MAAAYEPPPEDEQSGSPTTPYARSRYLRPPILRTVPLLTTSGQSPDEAPTVLATPSGGADSAAAESAEGEAPWTGTPSLLTPSEPEDIPFAATAMAATDAEPEQPDTPDAETPETPDIERPTIHAPKPPLPDYDTPDIEQPVVHAPKPPLPDYDTPDIDDRLAQHDGAGLARQRDARRIGGRTVTGMNRRAVGGRHVVRVDDVLHAEGQSVERPARPARRAVARAGLGERALGIETGKRLHDGIARGDRGRGRRGSAPRR